MEELPCKCFEPFIEHFRWMVIEGEDDIKLMPHILTYDSNVRVNYCPCCGIEVRNVEIKIK